MTKNETCTVLALSDRTLTRGWRYSGAGPPRFGWWGVTDAGDAIYLGRTLSDVAAGIKARLEKDGGTP